MPESTRHDSLDLNYIQDPDVRRALRAIEQQLTQTLTRQQAEIDALLETLLEKHVTSVGELKRILVRLQQNAARSVRIHEMIEAASPGAVQAH